MYKRLYIIGIAAYIFMFVLSAVFYKERILFLDPAFALFRLINSGSFCIEHYRFGDAFAQVMPLIALKAGLPINAILISYSLGLLSMYFITYIICGSVLKQYRYAVMILLLNVLFTADTFYWPISQVPQGMALVILILSLMSNNRKPVTGPLISVLLITLAFFHPLMAVVMVYPLLFFILRKDDLPGKKRFYFTGLLFFAILAVKMTLFRVPYERHSLSGLKNFIVLYPHYFNLYSNKQLLHNCITKYYWIPVIAVLITGTYIKQKQWGKMSFFITALLGYLLLVNITYPDAATPAFYMENLYLPVSLFLALPLLFDVVPVLEKRRLAFPLLVLIIVTGCVRLYTTHNTYTARLDYERKLLARYGDKKIIIAAKNVNKPVLQMLWGTPYEFLLLSVSEQHKPASVIIDDNPPHRQWAAGFKDALVVNWDIFLYKDLNQKYFPFADTTSGYIIDTITAHKKKNDRQYQSSSLFQNLMIKEKASSLPVL